MICNRFVSSRLGNLYKKIFLLLLRVATGHPCYCASVSFEVPLKRDS